MRRAHGSLHVFTFKDGVLSAVAHDLRISLNSFSATLDGDVVRAELELARLVVDGPMVQGALRAGDYDAAKRAEVEKAMHTDVLRSNKHPRAIFIGTANAKGDGFDVSGELELASKKASVSFEVKRREGAYTASFELLPSRWGIAQYKALLGAIRLKDVVRVELRLIEVTA